MTVSIAWALPRLCGAAAAARPWVQEQARLTVAAAQAGASARELVALIRRPVLKSGRMPAVIVLGGLETGAKALDLISARQDVVLATFEYPYAGPRRFAFPRTLLDAPKIKKAVAETPQDVEALHAFLRSRADVDPDRVCVLGASFGAPFALRAAADDPAIRCLVLVEGFAKIEYTAAHRMRQLWGGKLGPLARPLSRLIAWSLGLYLDWPAPERDAPRLRRNQRVLVIDARDDTTIPPASRRALWRALASSRARIERVTIPGGHLLAGRSAEEIGRITGIVERWIARPGSP